MRYLVIQTDSWPFSPGVFNSEPGIDLIKTLRHVNTTLFVASNSRRD